jgi:hypothetical protein
MKENSRGCVAETVRVTARVTVAAIFGTYMIMVGMPHLQDIGGKLAEFALKIQAAIEPKQT